MEGTDRQAGVATPSVTYRCRHCGTGAPAVPKRRLTRSGRWALVVVLCLGVVIPGVGLLLLSVYGEGAGLSPFATLLGLVVGSALLASALWVVGSRGIETVSVCPHCGERIDPEG